MAEDAPATPATPASPLARRRRILVPIVLLVALAIGGWALWREHAEGQYREESDNAYVGGNQVFVSPQVNGTVRALAVDETAVVHRGDLLLELDDVDARLGWEQARAALGTVARQVAQSLANATAADDVVRQREVDLRRAEADLQRRDGLERGEVVAAEEVEHARDSVAAARAALAAAISQARATRTAVAGTQLRTHPAVAQAASALEQAWVTLQRCRLVAPVDGVIARRTVQVGQRVAPGTNLLAVVPLQQLWVDVNLKENQLVHVRAGQPVLLHSDAYGPDVPFHGRVLGFGAGTGSAFAALPAQNATGNWIKVVQRLPVRVQLDPADLQAHPLRVGLSMTARIDTRERGGSGLRDQPQPAAAASTEVNRIDLAPARADIDRIVAEAGRGLAEAAATGRSAR